MPALRVTVGAVCLALAGCGADDEPAPATGGWSMDDCINIVDAWHDNQNMPRDEELRTDIASFCFDYWDFQYGRL